MECISKITDNDVDICRSILKLDNIPDRYYTKRIIANVFTKGYRLDNIEGLTIIALYNYLKDKYIIK